MPVAAAGGCWQQHQCVGMQQEGGLHHPCRLPQHGAVPVQPRVLAKGVLGAEKGGGRVWMVAEAHARERAVGLWYQQGKGRRLVNMGFTRSQEETEEVFGRIIQWKGHRPQEALT